MRKVLLKLFLYDIYFNLMNASEWLINLYYIKNFFFSCEKWHKYEWSVQVSNSERKVCLCPN